MRPPQHEVVAKNLTLKGGAKRGVSKGDRHPAISIVILSAALLLPGMQPGQRTASQISVAPETSITTSSRRWNVTMCSRSSSRRAA